MKREGTPGKSGEASRWRTGVVLGVAALIAVGTTAFLLGRRSAPPRAGTVAVSDPHHEDAHEDHGDGHGADEHGGVIRLDPAAAKTAGIRVEAARVVALPQSLRVPGTVEVGPDRVARVTPPVSGKVVDLLANVGDVVRAGQPLAILDSVEVAVAHATVRQAESGVRQASAALRTAQAAVQQARTALRNAETSLRGQQRLAEAGAFSQPSLQAAEAAVADAESELLQAQTEAQSHTTVLARAERLFAEQLIARSELEQAQAEQRQDAARVAQARARLDAARRTLAREQRLARGGLLSRQALLTHEAEVRSARSEVQRAMQEEQAARTTLAAARSAVAAAQANLSAAEGSGHTEGGGGRLALSAPISGVVTERHATAGEAVERSTDLFVIEDLRAVHVVARVPERDVARVRIGQRAEVTVASFPGRRFAGAVQTVGSRVEEKTRTLPVRILVRNPDGRLKPAMFATVTLATDGRVVEALAVPASAVGEEGEERFVFVREDGGYERRDVRPGRRSGAMVEIQSGLKEGDQVVTEGVFVLKSEGKKAELKGHEH